MKKFYSILIGFIFLGFISETNAKQQQPQHRGGQSAKAQRHGKAPASRTQKGKNGKKVIAKGKAGQKSAGGNTCTTKEIVTVVKGAKLLAHGKGSPALKTTYKKMLGCYSKIKGKAPKAIPKPLQSFAKGLKSACAKRAKNQDLAKVFKNTCGNSKAPAGAKGGDTCTTKEIVTVVKGAKLLAHGKGSPALKTTYKKMLGCYSKIKGKAPKAIPKPLQSFAKGLKSACAKRNTPEMKKVFAKTCGAIKAPLKKRNAPPPVADDEDDNTTQADDAGAGQDDTIAQTDDDGTEQDDDGAGQNDDTSMQDADADNSMNNDVSMDDDTSMQDVDSDNGMNNDVGMDDDFSDDSSGLDGNMFGGNTGFNSGGFDSTGDFSGNYMSGSYGGFNQNQGYSSNQGYSDPSMIYAPQGGGYSQPYGGGYGGYPAGMSGSYGGYPGMGGGYPSMNGGYGGPNLGF
mgnify:CR=1 FL=1